MVSSRREHEDEFLSAWELFQSRLKQPSPLQIIHYIFDDSSVDLVSFLDLLDRVRSGFFQLSCVLPPTSTWSRARHSELPGQLPLRSRSAPFGLDCLDTAALEQVQRANQQGEFCCWIAEQTLHCPTGKLVLIFPEDLGGDKNDGQSSIWLCREYQLLEGLHEARRGASFLCQLSSVGRCRPLGILSVLPALQSSLHLGWPQFTSHGSKLVYVGPLPQSCGCATPHTALRGAKPDNETLGPQFWLVCLRSYFSDVHPNALSDGEFCTYGSISPSSFVLSPLLPSFSSLPSSFYSLYVSWLSGGLSRETLRDACPSANTSQFFDTPIPCKLGQQKRLALEEKCTISNWTPSDDLIPVGKHSSGGIPSVRTINFSKLGPQQMAGRDEVGGSSGTIPPHCVPIESFGATCPRDFELDVAGLLCGMTATMGTQAASTCSSLEKLAQPSRSSPILPSSSTVWATGNSKRPLATEPRGTDGHGVSLGPSCGSAALVTRFF